MNVRIYFPDEGTAALMRRDWEEFKDDDRVRMTGFSRSGVSTATDDDVCIFYCPLASESDQLEKVLLKLEDTSYEGRLKTLVFMNDELIDMGVTGLGLNGRLLRERLLSTLVPVYTLKQLPYGTLTKAYPNDFTLWKAEPDASDGSGYEFVRDFGFSPSDDDMETLVFGDGEEKQEGGGFLDGLADFVRGMQSL